MNLQESPSLDNVPLAFLYPSLRAAHLASEETVLQLEDLTNPPPDYQDAEIPPAYQTKSQSVPPTKLHRFACFLVTYDLITNLVLLATTMINLVSDATKDAYLAMIVPIIFISAGVVGRSSFKRRRPILMLLYCGTYLARWCGDASVCIYAYANQFTQYYDMNVYTFFVSYLMVGIRGFYSNLFPCSTSSASVQSHCDSSQGFGQSIVSSPIMFLLILMPQLIFGLVMIFDAMYYFDLDTKAEFGDQ